MSRRLENVSRREFLGLAGAALAGAALAACAPGPSAPQPGAQQPTQATPRRGGVLKVAIIGEPPALDPGFTTATITQNTMWHVFEPLLTRDSKFTPIPRPGRKIRGKFRWDQIYFPFAQRRPFP